MLDGLLLFIATWLILGCSICLAWHRDCVAAAEMDRMFNERKARGKC